MRTRIAIFTVLCLFVVLAALFPSGPVENAVSPDARRLTCEAGGVFSQIKQMVSGWFGGGDENVETTEPVPREEIPDEDAFFSKNPLTYVVAFWTEIVNAPDDRTFMQRILAFLEAVRREQ